MKTRGLADPVATSILLILAISFEYVSAFVSFPIHQQPPSIVQCAETAWTNTTNELHSLDCNVRSLVPIKHRILKIQRCLQEMHARDAEGETLSQEYCDTILGLCVAADEWESVLDVLDVMKSHGLSQERSSYRACLQACFEMGNGASAQEIFRAMEHALVDPHPVDIGLVAAAMCRNNKQEKGWWSKAQALLLSKPSPEVPIESYNAVLACLCDERNWRKAIRLLRELERGSGEHRANKLYPEPTLATYREVIECCVAANQAEQAIRIVISMTEKGIQPTVYTFELVISASAKKLHWRRALQLLDLMEQCERPKTALTYNTIISACARAKELGMAKNLLSRMKKEGIKPNVVTYNSLISASASTGRWKDALQILDLCNRDPNCTPDIYTYTNAIRACAKGRKTHRALILHELVRHKKLPLDSYFYAAVIEACANAGMWKRALELLNEMEEEGVPPTEIIYSVTITACGNGGQWLKALDLLELMRSKELRLNLYVYNSAITALSKAAKQRSRSSNAMDNSNLSKKVLGLLDQMKTDGIHPDGFSFSSAISCCGAEGRWKEALGLMNLMKNEEPRTRPNRIAYTAAIAACGRAGEPETALRLFREMIDDGLSADTVAYNALFSALRVGGKSDVAFLLWQEMCCIEPHDSTTNARAAANKRTPPDIITVTEVIATLKDDRGRVDKVFAEAVNRGVVLPKTKMSLDTPWEVDLTSMSYPVARAACRYIVHQACRSVNKGEEVQDLNFVTGVGNSASQREGQQGVISSSGKSTNKREFVREILKADFNPPILSMVPKFAKGTVQIDKAVLQDWIKRNR